jgi:hypothetical protein
MNWRGLPLASDFVLNWSLIPGGAQLLSRMQNTSLDIELALGKELL